MDSVLDELAVLNVTLESLSEIIDGPLDPITDSESDGNKERFAPRSQFPYRSNLVSQVRYLIS
jgi:hypothetical protein